MSLAESKIRSKEWANGRGDIEGTPQYFIKQAQRIGEQFGVKVVVIEGDELIEKGFRLLHAVGRASVNKPAFVNLSYNGNPDSQDWLAFVGKGVCFDSGGLDIKPAAGMLSMFLDKHGATSVLSAFESIVKEKVHINVTCSIGLVENFINQNSYRPSDIIKSRKGLTVEIGNTDAEGRLVLCDCMHWTQENYKVHTLIEESTLTGAMIVSLGASHAGIYSNSKELVQSLSQAGEQVNELVWNMPLTDYNRDMMKSEKADLNNHGGKMEAGSAQAAAFLEHFVE